MTPHTDDLLGAALRELEVPEHRPEFHRELRRRLRAERRPRRVVRLGLLAAAAAIAAVLVATLRHGGSTAEAAVAQAKLRAALASFRNVSGEIVASGKGQGATVRLRFVLDRSGDVRLDGPRTGDVLLYDAKHLTFRSAQHSASIGGSTLFYAVHTGALPPALVTSTFGAYVQEALAAKSPSVEDVTYAGRPAWRLLIAAQGVRVTVDKGTGMAVEVVDLRHRRRIRIVGLRLDRALPAGTFSLRLPAGAEVSRFDSGYRPAPLAGAPHAPKAPAGYRLLRTARHGETWAFVYGHGFARTVRFERADRRPAP
jgi:outer membrane lipoprotein-sorting protein